MKYIRLEDLIFRAAFCDPASGKKEQIKRVRARSAIVVVGADVLSRFFVLHAWAERCSTDHLMDRIIEVNDQWRPRVFGIEANAMQSLFADNVQREARYKEKSIPIVPVYQPTTIDKDWRIRMTLQPVIANGRLLLLASQHELKVELVSFPMSATKDLVDALASAIALIPGPVVRRDQDEEMDARLAYLRESGAPASYIEQVIDEYELSGGSRR